LVDKELGIFEKFQPFSLKENDQSTIAALMR